jgi:hypothetical protein
VIAAERLGGVIDVVEVLSSTPRSIVARCRSGQRSVVLKYFRRRDSARNASGFGYLRAKFGAKVLPGAASVLAYDDEARVLIHEDLEVRPGRRYSAAELLRWARSWPDLVVPATSTTSEEFRASLGRSDPVSAAKGHPGALPSLGLARRASITDDQLRDFLDPALSVMWCGDMNPANFALDRDGTYRQLDGEGTGYCDPALLVVEARLGLPSAPDPGTIDTSPSPDQWNEIGNFLASRWNVTPERESIARLILASILRELAPTPSHSRSGSRQQ